MRFSTILGITFCLLLVFSVAGCTDSKPAPSEKALPQESLPAEQPTSSTESSVYVTDLNLQEEWIQISNIGSSPVSLAGWKIEDEGNKHTYTFPSYTLNAGSTVTVYTGKGTDSEVELYWQLDDPILNYDDTVYLYDDTGKLVSKRASKLVLTE